MKAIIRQKYGSSDVLGLREVEKPAPNEGEVLVKIHAASANPLDWHSMRGAPFLARLGEGLRKPIQPGQKVLINDASSGVGTFAVQIAKSFGAEVTAVCSTKNLDNARSMGADHVIDYTQEDFTKNRQSPGARDSRRLHLWLLVTGVNVEQWEKRAAKDIQMKAIVYTKYGPPDVLQLKEVAKPVPADDEILVKVYAVSVNRSDWEGLTGKPLYARLGGLRKPGHHILGSDVAGRVEMVGKNNRQFQLGDDVFGEMWDYHGGFAEYVCTHGRAWALKPARMTFEEAAAIPQAGVIALQGIRNQGQVQPGQKVLVNGAGGGAGMFAVQLAKMYGAEVTGVDNTGKLDFMRSLGADYVIDYTREDFTKNGKQYDLILDLIAHRSVFAYQRALKPNGSYFAVGGSLATFFQILLLGPWIRRTTGRSLRVLAVQRNRKDLVSITELCEAGKIVPVIDRQYPLSEVPEALRYLGEGRAKGKVVITVDHNS